MSPPSFTYLLSHCNPPSLLPAPSLSLSFTPSITLVLLLVSVLSIPTLIPFLPPIHSTTHPLYLHHSIYKAGGVKALFVGSAARVSWLLPFTTIYLGVYEVSKRRLLAYKKKRAASKKNIKN
jgi:Mitochondrial carrier protein